MRDHARLPGWPRGLGVELAAAYVGISSTGLRRELAADRFPKPVCLIGNRLVWLREDLDSYLDQKANRVASGNLDGREWMGA